MASLTIKGIPPELLEQLRTRAARHRRSLNSEVLHLLERSVDAPNVDVEAVLTGIRRLQDRTNLPPLTDEMLREAIDEGRP
jgi:plasmid stability protein